jgi:hypothetical protein
MPRVWPRRDRRRGIDILAQAGFLDLPAAPRRISRRGYGQRVAVRQTCPSRLLVRYCCKTEQQASKTVPKSHPGAADHPSRGRASTSCDTSNPSSSASCLMIGCSASRRRARASSCATRAWEIPKSSASGFG